MISQDTLHARILLDKTSLEVFWDNGLSPMTSIFFPEAPMESLSIATTKESLSILKLEVSAIDITERP